VPSADGADQAMVKACKVSPMTVHRIRQQMLAKERLGAA
jgi:hypothetical protein